MSDSGENSPDEDAPDSGLEVRLVQSQVDKLKNQQKAVWQNAAAANPDNPVPPRVKIAYKPEAQFFKTITRAQKLEIENYILQTLGVLAMPTQPAPMLILSELTPWTTPDAAGLSATLALAPAKKPRKTQGTRSRQPQQAVAQCLSAEAVADVSTFIRALQHLSAESYESGMQTFSVLLRSPDLGSSAWLNELSKALRVLRLEEGDKSAEKPESKTRSVSGWNVFVAENWLLETAAGLPSAAGTTCTAAGMHTGEKLSALGEKWRGLTDEEREPYMQMAKDR
jgi:hypothetical protein